MLPVLSWKRISTSSSWNCICQNSSIDDLDQMSGDQLQCLVDNYEPQSPTPSGIVCTFSEGLYNSFSNLFPFLTDRFWSNFMFGFHKRTCKYVLYYARVL